jgi:hypothetical protein
MDTNIGLGNTIEKAYDDLVHPSAKRIGEIVSLLPRAIGVALTPLEKYVLNGEYSLKATKKLLEEKLKDVDPEQIKTPEAYVAVPALQAIAYTTDNETLRDLFANLLAKAMQKDTADTVHPAFVEIIKQLSPDDAYTLKCFKNSHNLPIVNICGNPPAEMEKVSGFSNVHIVLHQNVFIANSEIGDIGRQSTSITSLDRLGLVDISFDGSSLTTSYDEFENLEIFQNSFSNVMRKVYIEKGRACLNPFGEAFINVCL